MSNYSFGTLSTELLNVFCMDKNFLDNYLDTCLSYVSQIHSSRDIVLNELNTNIQFLKEILSSFSKPKQFQFQMHAWREKVGLFWVSSQCYQDMNLYLDTAERKDLIFLARPTTFSH